MPDCTSYDCCADTSYDYTVAGGSPEPTPTPPTPDPCSQLSACPVDSGQAPGSTCDYQPEPPPTPIDPPDVADIGFWLKADADVFVDLGTTPCTDGQTSEQWNDQSGLGQNVTQIGSGERPQFQTNEINGLPIVRFSGALKNMVTTSFTYPQPFTVLAVVRFNADSNKSSPFFGDQSESYNGVPIPSVGRGTSSQNRVFDAANPALSGSNLNDGTVYYLTYVVNGVDSYTRINGVNDTTGDAGTSGLFGIRIGCNSSGGVLNVGLDIDIAEIIQYNRELDLAEIQGLESYLQRWFP